MLRISKSRLGHVTLHRDAAMRPCRECHESMDETPQRGSQRDSVRDSVKELAASLAPRLCDETLKRDSATSLCHKTLHWVYAMKLPTSFCNMTLRGDSVQNLRRTSASRLCNETLRWDPCNETQRQDAATRLRDMAPRRNYVTRLYRVYAMRPLLEPMQ